MKFNQIKKSFFLVFSSNNSFCISSCSSSKRAGKCNGAKMIKANIN